MGTAAELQQFLRDNRPAWQMAWKSCDDYMLCRLGMLNGLWSSFEMATQATEKLFKSYLLFHDAALGGDAKKAMKAVADQAKARGRTFERGHDVEACLDLAKNLGFTPDGTFETRLKRVNELYEGRYPDSGGPTSLSTKEMEDVDAVIFRLWDDFQNLNADFYLTGGIMRPVYGHFLHQHSYGSTEMTDADFRILTTANKAYEARAAAIEKLAKEMLAEWYPAT